MSKVSNYVNRAIQRIKLSQNKALTNFGLLVFTHNKNLKNICIKKDISYGTSKLQKYDLIYPNNCEDEKLPIAIYVHGGSWCGGDKYGYTMFCEKLTKKRYITININYRLMPKVSIRTCIADCIKAIKHFSVNYLHIFKTENINAKPDFDNVYLVGDSAGAHIVSLIAAKKTCGKLRLKMNISALGLYYGVYNFENISHDPSPIMTDLDKYWKSIYNNTKELYKEISTTNYVTSNFPATFMTSGKIDKLHFQSEIMYRLLKYSNVKIEYLSFEKSRQDGRHAFLNAPFLPSAKEAFSKLTKFLEENKKR
jgi:acetyl esterase/lipase